jgi:hypothetical protein
VPETLIGEQPIVKNPLSCWIAGVVRASVSGCAPLSQFRLPQNITGAIAEIADIVTTMDLRWPPTSIRGLSPKSPFLQALDQRPIEAPHHTIVGDRGRGDSPNSSDGVLPYSSAHLATAESELIVPAGHGAFRHPMAIAEIERMLRDSKMCVFRLFSQLAGSFARLSWSNNPQMEQMDAN